MKFAAAAITILGFASQTEAYKIRKWNDITEKTPITAESYHEMRRFYELIYTLGWSALNTASTDDVFDVKGKFGIELSLTSDNLGFQGLAAFQAVVDSKGKDLNDDKESVDKFRTLVQDLEQEMLLMNAALAFGAGFMDKVDQNQAEAIRSAREDFLFQSQAFERDQMWAARSWNRVWKKQGLPQRGYEILEAKFGQQIDEFKSVAKKIFDNGAGAPDGFSANEKFSEIKSAVEAMFQPGADSATMQTAYDVVDAKWREFSAAFVSSNMVASTNVAFSFEEEYQKAMDALRSYGSFDSVRGLITFCQNRVVWAGKAAETQIDDDLKQYGDGSLNYFFNQYQVEAGKAGAKRGGYLSNEVDNDFARLSKGYEDSIKTLLLVGINPDDVAAAMDMAKIVWKASRE